MKIHFVIGDLGGGGAQRVMAILANDFAQKGHDISIITLYDNEGGDAYEIDDKIKRVELQEGRIKNRKLRAFFNLTSFYRPKINRPDVIISFLSLINLIAILVAKIYGIKIIASEHNNHLQPTEPKNLTHFTWNYIYRWANKITVLTAFDLGFYKNRKADVVVMPNPRTFMPNFSAVDHAKSKTILAVGNLNRYHHKGFDNLIPLIEPVLKENPDWKLKILGGGDKGAEFLKSLAEAGNVNDQIIFAGFQSNVGEHMLDASIFVLPSRFEGLPMVLLEAMAQGMACIAYDCKTGPSDIIEDGVNGILIEDQNLMEMQNGLKLLIENEELRKKVSIKAINSLERFSIETISTKWMGLFEQLEL